MPEKVTINAIAYQEGDAWIAQGIEFDIVAHADDPLTLADTFARVVFENICITQHLGRRPLEGLKPAPDQFRQMYERAGYEVRSLKQRADSDISMRVAA